MVILFSGRNNSTEKEIIKILTKYGADYISDKTVKATDGPFIIISEYKRTDIKIKNGIAVFIDDTERFNNQILPNGMIGICEDTNAKALDIFRISGTPVISCGMNSKNTVTLSSFGNSEILAALQRTMTDFCGKEIEPSEFKIKLSEAYTPFAITASAAILLLKGIMPEKF